MGETENPLFQTPGEQRRTSLDLMKRLLATIDQWGKAQGRKDPERLSDATINALLQTVTAICVFRELSSLGESPKNVQAFFQRIYKDGPIEAEEPEMLLALRARKDVLFRKLERDVHAF